MRPWLSDPDLDLYVGDVRTVLAGLPDESVDCCVTSPPYWGLRDYGTGLWDGGDPDCDHANTNWDRGELSTRPSAAERTTPMRDVCGRCGAHRVDQQLGLEPTPQEYVNNMVDVFRQVRRVLRPHGTLWLNLGDSYAGQAGGAQGGTGSNATRTAGILNIRKGLGGSIPPGLKPKDLCGIPWRVAFALQADGWYLRSDIVWSKPNPMPESVTDRPTKAHEYVFLLSKQPRYWFDQEAVREPNADPAWTTNALSNPAWQRRSDSKADASRQDGGRMANGRPHTFATQTGRNIRSVWQIATQPYAEAHFATFPEELPRRCVLAGCPEWVCGTCGKARERLVERERYATRPGNASKFDRGETDGVRSAGQGSSAGNVAFGLATRTMSNVETVGWSDCGHNAYVPGTTLDPFFGSGTTGLVARKHGRRTIGIELNPEYARLAARRLQQLSLLTEGSAA